MSKTLHDRIVTACGLCAVLTLTGFVFWVTYDALTTGYIG